MKKKMVKSIVCLLGTFLVTSASLFSYVEANNIPTVTHAISDSVISITKVENVVEETSQEEVTQEPEAVEPVVDVVPETPVVQPAAPVTYTAPAISGDHIKVAGVTRNLMKDGDGSHFYLNHNMNGVYDGVGVPYVDFRHDFTGRKTIIYSHSSTSGNGPFQALQNYHNNPGFYWNNRYITVQYQGNTYTYEIFSVYVSVADSEESEGLEYFHRMSYTTSEWGETIQKYKNNSEYDTGVSVSENDHILILQTCSMDPNYYARYYRYNLLIMGKLV